MRLLVLIVALLANYVVSTPSAVLNERHIIHEKTEQREHLWARRARATGFETLHVRVGLKQRNLQHSERFIADISDPNSTRFGKHWTAGQVANMFAPSKETSDRVMEWLLKNGIEEARIKHSKGRNWLEFDSSVAETERLFRTEYYVFENLQNGNSRIACDSYSLPERMREHIDLVTPTILLDDMMPLAMKTQPTTSRAKNPYNGLTGLKYCNELITIECLRAIYNIPVAKYNHSNNAMGIPEWASYLYYSDLEIFFDKYTSPRIPKFVRPEFISIDGGLLANSSAITNNKFRGYEAALDFQTSYSIIYPQNIRRYQLGDGVNVNGIGTFNILLDALDESYCTYLGGDAPYIDPEYPDPDDGGYTGPLQCGGAPTSNVMSISYGQIEGALPTFYQERQCHEWMKLALQGVSVVFASGDSGVANLFNGGYNNSCINSTYGFVSQNGDQFSPSFPANCPYVTTVGATTLLTTSIHGGERAVAEKNEDTNPFAPYFSGGGFANVFPRPSWQESAVTKYLKNHGPNYGSQVYNRSGRGYPDVSVLGLNLVTVAQGIVRPAGGTSAAAPIFASIINLLNEERIQMGKGPIGFLNPIIYHHPEMFNDITVGSNPGCGTKGFSAAPGWDPVTGMGTPNYTAMSEVFRKLP